MQSACSKILKKLCYILAKRLITITDSVIVKKLHNKEGVTNLLHIKYYEGESKMGQNAIM